MKLVSGMQGMRNQERDWGARKEGKKKKEWTEDSRKRKEMIENRARITQARRKTRGKVEWLSKASVQGKSTDCCSWTEAVGYTSLKKGRIQTNLSSLCSQELFLNGTNQSETLHLIFPCLLNGEKCEGGCWFPLGHLLHIHEDAKGVSKRCLGNSTCV